ncbi:hypothetical protein HEK616_30170 [Streptomyces nigrescens]|uniref:Uncharacterized protein n=1 Tax=Streptomyces nigrescens TaxID=1920 RepID=A0ABM7ZT31_STRNI|nr:hypothetical protein HEK616_30170 [Streptomyces nigrescens]
MGALDESLRRRVQGRPQRGLRPADRPRGRGHPLLVDRAVDPDVLEESGRPAALLVEQEEPGLCRVGGPDRIPGIVIAGHRTAPRLKSAPELVGPGYEGGLTLSRRILGATAHTAREFNKNAGDGIVIYLTLINFPMAL